jgi:hypothetical protein
MLRRSSLLCALASAAALITGCASARVVQSSAAPVPGSATKDKIGAQRLSPAALDGCINASLGGEARFIIGDSTVEAEYIQPACQEGDGLPNDCPDVKFAFAQLRYDKTSREIFLSDEVVAKYQRGGGFIWNWRPSGFILSKGYRLNYEWIRGSQTKRPALQVFPQRMS